MKYTANVIQSAYERNGRIYRKVWIGSNAGTHPCMLWSRFYSCKLLDDHIAKAIRYVERNPVRAGMVGLPWQYTWSSARAQLGKQYKLIILSDIKDYVNIASWKDYLVQEDEKEDVMNIRKSTQQGKAVGPSSKIEDLERTINCKLKVSNRGRPSKVD